MSAETDVGHVQMNNRDIALLNLYEALSVRSMPKPGTFSSLGADERREYFTQARRRNRGKEKAAARAGAIPATTANVRDALADAALMILATGAPGTDQVLNVLAMVFVKRAGVPMAIEAKARQGKLRPKLVLSPGAD